MSEWTHTPPDAEQFLRAIRKTLAAMDDHELSTLLAGARCEFSVDGTFGRRWNARTFTFRVRVPVERLRQFSAIHQRKLEELVEQLLSSDVGYDLDKVEFAPFAVGQEDAPADDLLGEVLKPDHEHVRAAWQKALERRETDPEGAITAARTLLEAVCKHILDDLNIPYDPGADLARLYKDTAKALKLAPEQHQEDIFKQVLSGCISVVNGLAGVRNSLSDAHGRGKRSLKPEPRHAELAVNLACSMASFLVRTHETRGTARN